MTVIVSVLNNSESGAAASVSERSVCPVTGPGSSGGQIRVTFENNDDRIGGGGHNLKFDHVSVGKWAGTRGDTTLTPVELTFSGGHGFTLPAGTGGQSTFITSDWVTINFSFTTADSLVIIADVDATDSNVGFSTGNSASFSMVQYNSAATYNSASPGAPSNTFSGDALVKTVEVQAPFSTDQVAVVMT